MIARRSVLLLPWLEMACTTEGSPETFALPSYRYLTPIRLNVAAIEVDDRSPPALNSLDGVAPVRPVDALKQMAIDRLTADGSAGRGVFVIDQATLTRNNEGIGASLAVHLDVFAGLGGQRTGYAEARVVRRRISGSSGEDQRMVLYDFTLQMMNDMNIEFEYQVRRSLRDWVQNTVDTAPLPPPVEAQPLSNGLDGAQSPPPAADFNSSGEPPVVGPAVVAPSSRDHFDYLR